MDSTTRARGSATLDPLRCQGQQGRVRGGQRERRLRKPPRVGAVAVAEGQTTNYLPSLQAPSTDTENTQWPLLEAVAVTRQECHGNTRDWI